MSRGILLPFMRISLAPFEPRLKPAQAHTSPWPAFSFRAATVFRGILVSFMRICRARFETLGSNQRRLSGQRPLRQSPNGHASMSAWLVAHRNKRQQDSLTPTHPPRQKKKPVSSVSKEDEPVKTRVTTSIHLYLTAQTSSGTFLYTLPL